MLKHSSRLSRPLVLRLNSFTPSLTNKSQLDSSWL